MPRRVFRRVATLRARHINHNTASRLSGVHGGDNSRHDFLDVASPVSTENHDRDFATFQILLIDEVLIGREQKVDPASSATRSRSPFACLAVLIMWPCKNLAIGTGVL